MSRRDCHLSLSYFLCLGRNAYLQSVYLAKSAYLPTEHIDNARIYSFFNFFCLVILPERVVVPEKLTPSSAWSSCPVTPVDRSNAQPKSREVRFIEWTHRGLPCWLRRQSICPQCGRPEFSPWVRKIPWKRARQPTPVFLSRESQGRKSLGGYSPQDCKESAMTEVTEHTHIARNVLKRYWFWNHWTLRHDSKSGRTLSKMLETTILPLFSTRA